MNRHYQALLVTTFVATFMLIGCQNKTEEIVILSKTLHSQRIENTAVPSEFGSFAVTTGNTYWVEGTVQNRSSEDATEVLIIFKCTTGGGTKTLSAEIPLLPAGKTLPFHTRRLNSQVALQLTDEEPEVSAK